MNKKITTPVLLLVFNKPEKTQQVFDVIRQVKPTKLYVAADAPRIDNLADIELCQKVRDIVLNVDWECETHYLFHEKNVGCSMGGKTAWDWFFSKEEEMIFLEDDGVASISFFGYCQDLLEKYRFDTRISYIGGVNYDVTQGDATYFFSRYSSGSYGMASWKRVYDLYEYNLESYYETVNTKQFKTRFVNKFSYKFMKTKFIHYIKRGGNTYDIQMVYLMHKYNMWSIIPNVNMVTDIGYDHDATNNIAGPDSPIAKKYGNKTRVEIDHIKHPLDVTIDKTFEKMYFKHRVLHGVSWQKAWINFYIKPVLLSLPFVYSFYKVLKKYFGKNTIN